MSRLSTRWNVALLVCAFGCGGRSVETITLPGASSAGTAGSAAIAGSAGLAGSAGIAGASGATSGGAAGASSGAAGASSGAAGTGGAAGTAGEAGAHCLLDQDCPLGPPCGTSVCNAGRCELAYIARGSPVAQDSPADCQATVCDGAGSTMQTFDPSNLPSSSDPCLLGVCDEQGQSALIAAAAGVTCSSSFGAGRCDGAGSCVQCLTASDCSSGACVAHACASVSCADTQRNGDETDVDCGGSCSRCADAKRCLTDQDCASDDCDSLWLVCLPHSCIDQSQDGIETDVDCGGGDCAGCYPGKKCLLDRDCATNKCDPVRLTCGGNSCADQRQDGEESDIDCGGIYCAPCKHGQKCVSSFDCAGGLLCSISGGLPARCL